jgi:ribose/xylose/arabinose/galactoside ABC-type transport system permease subunit
MQRLIPARVCPVEWSYWLSMASVALVGFLLTFTRPGFSTFAVEQR